MLTAAAGAQDGTPNGDPAAGRRFAESHCARCHAIGPKGDSPFAGAPPFRDLHKRWDPSFLQEALAEGIRVGHPAMPEFVLSPEEIDDFLAYLASLSAADKR